MASELERISEAFRLLATVTFPDGYLGDLELAVVNAHLHATRRQRAAKLLATRGPDVAAVMLGCSRGHVYALARSPKTGRSEDEAA